MLFHKTSRSSLFLVKFELHIGIHYFRDMLVNKDMVVQSHTVLEL